MGTAFKILHQSSMQKNPIELIDSTVFDEAVGRVLTQVLGLLAPWRVLIK